MINKYVPADCLPINIAIITGLVLLFIILVPCTAIGDELRVTPPLGDDARQEPLDFDPDLHINLDQALKHPSRDNLKYSKNDETAFTAAKATYGPLIQTRGEDTRYLEQRDEGLLCGLRLTWKLEEGAWRLSSVQELAEE